MNNNFEEQPISNNNSQNNNNNNIDDLEKLEDNLAISKELYTSFKNINIDDINLNDIIKDFHSENIETKFRALVCLRKKTIKDDETIKKINDLQILPQIIGYLENSRNEFIYEALWCLTNLTIEINDQSMNIISYEGINKIMPLMDSKIQEIKCQSIWVIGNIVSGSDKIREILIEKGIFDKLMNILSDEKKEEIIETTLSTISNFFRSKTIPSYGILDKAFKITGKKIVENNYTNSDILISALYIFECFCRYFTDLLKEFVEINLVQKIRDLLDNNEPKVIRKCLNIIKYFSEGNDEITQIIIDYNILEKFKKTLFYQEEFSNETCWIISNIACGTKEQKEILIKQGFFELLKKSFYKNTNKKPSLFAICNFITTINDNNENLTKLASEGIIKIIFEGLKIEEKECLKISLESIECILNFGKKMDPTIKNPFAILFKKLGIIPILENLKLSIDEDVKKDSIKLINEYFNDKIN